ncbi:MAG: hypothetical protein QOE27_2460, partial [Solirubrobacteraceae bacterium]|nr:hypothetical protein [Solirubrobacteraceae bacterium]
MRHRLAPRGSDVAGVAGDLVGLHATDPASVMLAARRRVRGVVVADVERALYEERTVVRMLGMRRTMFVVPVDLMPVVQAACTAGLVLGERRKLIALLEAAGIAGNGAEYLAAAETAALGALGVRGEATAAELGRDVPALGRQIVLAAGKSYEGRQSVATRVLFLLAAEGLIVRGRPLGSWTSSLNRWTPVGSWLADPPPGIDEGPAGVELVRRWLTTYGPGTLADLKWWTGWTAGRLKRALGELGPGVVGRDGGRVGLV